MDVTKVDLDGLGKRIQSNADNYLKCHTGVEKDIQNMQKVIGDHDDEFNRVYDILDAVRSMTYKIIGGVAAIVILSQVIGGFILFKVTG